MSFNRSWSSIINNNEKNTFWISISDLMAGLLIIFILTLTYYMLNFSEATAHLTKNDEKREEILESIEAELNERGIQVKVFPEYGVLRLPEGILFDTGEAKISENGQQVISVLAPVLYEVLTEPEYKGSVETVFIEGHTDDVPIYTSNFASNWELSTQRAINTWNALKAAHNDLENLKNVKGEYLFSCSGYADTRPVASNETRKGRRENRRIDLRFSMIPPSPPDESAQG